MIQGRKAFPLVEGTTGLEKSDYRFLERFLDVTKANLFFARGVLIVEGDGENILIPTLARLIGRNFTEHGVSIVNVGHTGLRRFARVFQRKEPDKEGVINVPVACIADMDVMPNCAPVIIGKVKEGDAWPNKGRRGWLAKSDFTAEKLAARRELIRKKHAVRRWSRLFPMNGRLSMIWHILAWPKTSGLPLTLQEPMIALLPDQQVRRPLKR